MLSRRLSIIGLSTGRGLLTSLASAWLEQSYVQSYRYSHYGRVTVSSEGSKDDDDEEDANCWPYFVTGGLQQTLVNEFFRWNGDGSISSKKRYL